MAIQHSNTSSSLADILERVLDKGIVVAGDIKISIADIELINIKVRLLVASVERAKEMGIDWWEHDPYLSSKARDRIVDCEIESKENHKDIEESNHNPNKINIPSHLAKK